MAGKEKPVRTGKTIFLARCDVDLLKSLKYGEKALIHISRYKDKDYIYGHKLQSSVVQHLEVKVTQSKIVYIYLSKICKTEDESTTPKRSKRCGSANLPDYVFLVEVQALNKSQLQDLEEKGIIPKELGSSTKSKTNRSDVSRSRNITPGSSPRRRLHQDSDGDDTEVSSPVKRRKGVVNRTVGTIYRSSTQIVKTGNQNVRGTNQDENSDKTDDDEDSDEADDNVDSDERDDYVDDDSGENGAEDEENDDPVAAIRKMTWKEAMTLKMPKPTPKPSTPKNSIVKTYKVQGENVVAPDSDPCKMSFVQQHSHGVYFLGVLVPLAL